MPDLDSERDLVGIALGLMDQATCAAGPLSREFHVNDKHRVAPGPNSTGARVRRFLKLRPHHPQAVPTPEDVRPKRQARPTQYKHLPDRVKRRDIATAHETRPSGDPEGGRDTDRDFLIRYVDDLGDL
jgi:hypothetical protein